MPWGRFPRSQRHLALTTSIFPSCQAVSGWFYILARQNGDGSKRPSQGEVVRHTAQLIGQQGWEQNACLAFILHRPDSSILHRLASSNCDYWWGLAITSLVSELGTMLQSTGDRKPCSLRSYTCSQMCNAYTCMRMWKCLVFILYIWLWLFSQKADRSYWQVLCEVGVS